MISYVAIGKSECKECSRLLDDVMNTRSELAFNKLEVWLNHANSDDCDRRKRNHNVNRER